MSSHSFPNAQWDETLPVKALGKKTLSFNIQGLLMLKSLNPYQIMGNLKYKKVREKNHKNDQATRK